MNNLLTSCSENENIVGRVEGTIPEWLNVNMLRLGPAKWDLDDGFSLNHWLDGCGMVCKFSIEEGTVKFNSKFVQSNSYSKMVTQWFVCLS